MNNFSTIIQWNIQSINKKGTELQTLMNEYHPLCICLQEACILKPNLINYKRYDLHLSPPSRLDRYEKGAAILIHKTLYYTPIPLTTRLQAVALRVKLDKEYTICSIYLPPRNEEEITQAAIQSLIDQLPTPFLILGDMNARSSQWGNTTNNSRGDLFEDLILQNDILLLNNGQPTHYHIQTDTYTVIDLSISSGDCFTDFLYTVDESLHGSDHYPIHINQNNQTNYFNKFSTFNTRKANWKDFKELTKPTINTQNKDVIQLTAEITQHIIEAAKQTIPINPKMLCKPPIPWWNNACREAKKERIRAERSMQRNYNECYANPQLPGGTMLVEKRKKRESEQKEA